MNCCELQNILLGFVVTVQTVKICGKLWQKQNDFLKIWGISNESGFWFCSWGLNSAQLQHWRSYLLAECCLWKTKQNKTKLVQTRMTSLSGKYLQLIIWPRSLHSVLVHRFYFTDTRLGGKEYFKHSFQFMNLLAKLAQKGQEYILWHWSLFGW